MKPYVLGGFCRKGHKLTEESLYNRPSDGSRSCRICRKKFHSKYASEHKSEIRERQRIWTENNRRQRSLVARRSHLKKKFNITPEEYVKMVLQQHCKCLICGDEPNQLQVDHSHKLNKVRALLCRNCNLGIGHFKEDMNRLHNAIAYLGSFSEAQ